MIDIKAASKAMNMVLLNSNHCVICFKAKNGNKILAIKVKEENKDLLPFDFLGTPCCILCQRLEKDLDADLIWLNILKLIENYDCEIIDGRQDAPRLQ